MVSRVGRIREQDVVGGNSLVFDCLSFRVKKIDMLLPAVWGTALHLVEVFSLVINVWKALAHQSLFDASVAVVTRQIHETTLSSFESHGS